MYEILCGGVLFNEITRINSRPAALAKKGLQQRSLPVNLLELLPLLQEGLA